MIKSRTTTSTLLTAVDATLWHTSRVGGQLHVPRNAWRSPRNTLLRNDLIPFDRTAAARCTTAGRAALRCHVHLRLVIRILCRFRLGGVFVDNLAIEEAIFGERNWKIYYYICEEIAVSESVLWHPLWPALTPEIVHAIRVHDLAETLQQARILAHDVTLALQFALRLLQLDGHVRLVGGRAHIDGGPGAVHFAAMRLEARYDPRLHEDFLFFRLHYQGAVVLTVSGCLFREYMVYKKIYN